ncbi:hypothetical protein BN1013_01514 [Candidatus Rubidus massiliensis]|nr:MAG: hypothetical protein BGO10_04950 [Chlamydia sp. 32-24]CDZ80986.1 hypothetical protein BN1013_01514 [Candidatus Rubidus massiliensis]
MTTYVGFNNQRFGFLQKEYHQDGAAITNGPKQAFSMKTKRIFALVGLSFCTLGLVAIASSAVFFSTCFIITSTFIPLTIALSVILITMGSATGLIKLIDDIYHQIKEINAFLKDFDPTVDVLS